jgi:threonine dehydratase
MQKYVDDVILVTEVQIKDAIRYAWRTYGEIIEGSAAVGIAARLTGKIQSQSALTVITGGNIQPELLHTIITEK